MINDYPTIRSAILDYIVAFKAANDGLSPSYRRMSADLGISIGKLQRAILVLIGDGELRRGPRGGLMVRPFDSWDYVEFDA